MRAKRAAQFISLFVVISMIIPAMTFAFQSNIISDSQPVISTRVAGYEGQLFYGQLHNHAGEYGDDGTGSVEANLDYMKSSGDPDMDFGGLSPHSHMLSDSGMLNYWSDMATRTDASFVAIPAQEWSSLSTSNHVNVYYGNARCGVSNGNIPGFYSWLETSGGYGSFNHPGYGNNMNNWAYNGAVDKPGNYAGKMISMEMDRSPGSDSDFYDYITALNKGWHIGIINSDDNHDGDPGTKYANRPRTGMWTSSLTEANVETAMQELRFFGTQLLGGYIDLEAGGNTMGDIFTGGPTTLYAMLNSSFTYSSVELYMDGSSYPMSQVNSTHYSYTINAGEEHYYFVRARESGTNAYIISSPMWSTGTPPVPVKPKPATNVTAEVKGSDVEVRWNLSVEETSGSFIESLTPSADAQVVEGDPSSNFGGVDYMYVQSDVSTSWLNERSWLQFDLTGQLPADATIISATLSLYCYKANTADMEGVLYSAPDTWTESGLTWNNQPAYGAALDTQSLIVGQLGRYEWDITGHVQTEWAGDKVASMVLRALEEDADPTQTYAFEASENPDPSLRPYLEIDYTSSVSGIIYKIYRGTSYDAMGTGYTEIGQVSAGTTSFTDTGAGDGDLNEYYYYIRTVSPSLEFNNSESQAGKYIVPIDAGWNMISTPLILGNESIASVLQTLSWTRAEIYDPLDFQNPWKSNYPARPDYLDEFSAVTNNQGLWVYSNAADNLIVAGQVPTTTIIQLKAGWNLVGYPSDALISISELMSGTGYDKLVEIHNPAAPYLVQIVPGSYLMRPGEAYWIHVPADAVWTVSW